MVNKERYVALGLDTDSAPDKRKPDSFWDAENIYIVNNGRNLSVKPILGETKVVDFPEARTDKFYILGYCVFQSNIYVFCATGISGDDAIYKIDSSNNITKIINGDFGWEITDKIEAVANYESEDVIKLYFVDGRHQLRYVNVATTYSTYITRGLDMVDIVTLSTPEVTITSGGNLIAGNIQYVYNLYNQFGSQSVLSPASEMTSVTKYLEGYGSQENTGLKAVITIPTIDTGYDFIKIYSIHYQEYEQSPKVTLIIDQAIQGQTSITIEDGGTNFVAELGLTDLLSINPLPYIPNTLAIKRNRLFLGNYESDSFDPDIDVRAYSYEGSAFTSTQLKNNDVIATYSKTTLDNFNTLVADKTNDCINPYYDTQKYVYGSNSVFGGTGVNFQYTLERETIVRDGTIPNKSLKQEEIYRIGVVLYNKYGQASPVKWIADFKTPFSTTQDSIYKVNINLVSGAAVTRLTNAGVVGYQLCIVERKLEDRTIVAQGFIVPTLKYVDKDDNNLNPNYYYPYFITKDIIDSGRDLTEGGNLLNSYVEDKDFNTQDAGPPITYSNKPEQNNFNMMFYSSDTIFDNFVVSPTHVKFLGTVSGLASEINTTIKLNWWRLVQEGLVLYYNSGVFGGDSTHWTLGDPRAAYMPTCIMDQSKIDESDPDVHIIEIDYNKTYKTLNKWSTGSRPANVSLTDIQFLQEGQAKLMTSGKTVSNGLNLPYLLDPDPTKIPGYYVANYAPSLCLEFSSSSWHTGGSYAFDKFDAGNARGTADTRALPLVELVQTLTNQYGGNTYEAKQRNEYLKLGKIRVVDSSVNSEYIGDVWVGTLSVNRQDGLDSKYNGGHTIYEYIHTPYLENNHNVYARQDSLHSFSVLLQGEFNSKLFRLADNNKLLGAYNQQATLFKAYPTPYNFINTTKFPLSILGSDPKTPGELLDNWLVMNPNNVKLLEGQYGTISKLYNLSGDLLALQSTGIALVEVEPRVQTQSEDGLNIQLGIGSLFYNHKYLTTNSGTNRKFTVTDDGKNLYYYDDNLNIICMLAEGKISTLKSVKAILDAYPAGPHTTTFFNKNDIVLFQYDNFVLVYDILSQKFVSKYTLLNSNKHLIPNNKTLYQFDDSVSEVTTLYTQLTGDPKASKIVYLMCPNPVYEKVFHNLEYRLKGTNFTTVKVYNEINTSGEVNTDIETKFDIHRMHLPRVQNSRDRWRGIYVFVELNNTDDFSLDDMVLMYNIKG